jgi:hypothetical protein
MLNSTVDTGDGKRYGMGWWTNPDFYGYRVVFGAGGSADSTAYFYAVPSEGIVVAVLSNTGTLLLSKLVEEVLSQLLPRFHERREKAEPAKPPAENSNSDQRTAALERKWTGEIQTWRGAVPLTLSISHTREIHARIGSKDGVLQRAVVEDGQVYGVVQGNVGTPDAPRPTYNLEFELYLRGDTLAGAATTRSRRGPRIFPRCPQFQIR